ncbi:MAG: helix-turn-helix domain-containing protein [Acidobacteriota bacterium]
MPTLSDCGCSIQDKEIGSCYCVLEPLVQAVGRRHALQVLNVIAAQDRVHFREIQERLGGLSSSTLADRLHELEGVGLIRRVVEDLDSPRSEYRLTPKGLGLRESLRSLFSS